MRTAYKKGKAAYDKGKAMYDKVQGGIDQVKGLMGGGGGGDAAAAAAAAPDAAPAAAAAAAAAAPAGGGGGGGGGDGVMHTCVVYFHICASVLVTTLSHTAICCVSVHKTTIGKIHACMNTHVQCLAAHTVACDKHAMAYRKTRTPHMHT
jgi:hypothetical protein